MRGSARLLRLLWSALAVALLPTAPPVAAQQNISVSVTLELLPGVKVTAPPGGTGAPGDTVLYLFSVQNTGSLATSYRLSVTCPSRWSAALPQHPNKQLGPLQPGQSEIVPVAVTIAASAVPGTQGNSTLTATADQKPRPSDQATVTTTVVPAPPPPKVVTAPPGQTGVPGGTVTYQFEVKNIGASPTSFRLQVSSSPRWATSLPAHPSGTTGSLAPGQVEIVPVAVQIPAGAAIGATCSTTLSVVSLSRPKLTGKGTTTTAVVSPSGLAVSITREQPTAGADVARWRVVIANSGEEPRSIRLTAQSLRGWPVSVGGQDTEIEVPAGRFAEASLAMQLPRDARGEDYVIISVEDLEAKRVVAQAAVMVTAQ